MHYLARHPTFERAVGLAFDQIRHFGASNPGIVRKLVEVFTRLASSFTRYPAMEPATRAE